MACGIAVGMSPASVRCLVVDDSAPFRQILATILRALGCRDVRMAANGLEAVEAMRSFKTDVVFLDQHMGPMDGLSFARYIRTAPDSPARGVGLLMVTAQADVGMVAAAKAVGIDSFLAKPVTTIGLARSLERAMQAVEARRAPPTAAAAASPAPKSDDVYEL
jgi:CheY-like chemotaxis protein